MGLFNQCITKYFDQNCRGDRPEGRGREGEAVQAGEGKFHNLRETIS